MKALLTALSILFCIRCNPCEPFDKEIYPVETHARYFDSMGVARLNKCLKRYSEPPLDQLDHESYRLYYEHVFSDTTQMMRIGNRHSAYYFIHKKLVPDSDSTMRVSETIELPLLPQEWEVCKTIIYRNGYWTLPREIDRYGLDGGTYILEGRRPEADICGKRSYHLVSRWSPKEGAYRQICDQFLTVMKSIEDRTHK